MQMGSRGCCTHGHALLEVFLATNKMRDLCRDIIREGASIDMYPFAHLFNRALFSKVASDCNDQAFEGLFPHLGTAGLVAASLSHP